MSKNSIQNLDVDVKDYDPISALDGGADGLDDYRTLSDSILQVLKQKGLIFFEIGQSQESDVAKIMQAKKMRLEKSYRDLGNIVRVLVFSR